MKGNEDQFPGRVTLYEDGVYRWAYEMDMWENRYLIGLLTKILSLVMGLPTLFICAMVCTRLIPLLGQETPRDELMWRIGGDLQLLYIVGGIWLGCILLALIIYVVCALAMRGKWCLHYEMDETAVALVRNPNTMQAVNTLGSIATVMGLLAGDPGGAVRIGGTLAVANNTGTSRFMSTGWVTLVSKWDVLDLREFMGMNQVYVPKEDYDCVKQFILAHVSEKARLKSEMREK